MNLDNSFRLKLKITLDGESFFHSLYIVNENISYGIDEEWFLIYINGYPAVRILDEDGDIDIKVLEEQDEDGNFTYETILDSSEANYDSLDLLKKELAQILDSFIEKTFNSPEKSASLNLDFDKILKDMKRWRK